MSVKIFKISDICVSLRYSYQHKRKANFLKMKQSMVFHPEVLSVTLSWILAGPLNKKNFPEKPAGPCSVAEYLDVCVSNEPISVDG